jgi:hypothetical protein
MAPPRAAEPGASPSPAGPAPSEQARAQLAVLGDIGALLAALRVRCWLRGGWAVDFLLGRITRPHADLDLVLWARHRRRARRALLDAGFRLVRETPVQTDLRKDGQDVSLVFLARAPDGAVITHGIPDWTWPAGSLPPRPRRLHGVAARVVDPRQLLAEKEGYERGTGRPPRPKDLESIGALRRIVAEQPPGKAAPEWETER